MFPIDADEFVQTVKPHLASQDAGALIALLQKNWSPHQIIELIHGDHIDAKKVALLAASLVAPVEFAPRVAEQLRDPDPIINGLAEHALWSIWFRGSDCCDAKRQVRRGCEALNTRDFDVALESFESALSADPDFAEAYNQRAICHYLEERYADSITDCKATVKRMPCHFGAWAGMGHCLAHLGKLRQAVDSYERALEINPHLTCVSQAVATLRRQLRKRGGEF